MIELKHISNHLFLSISIENAELSKKYELNNLGGILLKRNIDYTFKILMLGSASTGKTSLSDRYISGVFDPNIRMTVGVEFYVKNVDILDKDGESKRVKLQIWDLGGESRFRFLLPTYCLGSSGALFLFDLTRSETLLTLDSWITIVKERNAGIPIILVGNKVDLKKYRKIPEEHGIQTTKHNNMVEYIEVSALNGTNVEEVFKKITKYMMNRVDL